ncbi:hypothetical protein RB195_019645 [Necator americanus]|uniref:Uncharacterized protein n=1 Tax=Necator americanus TaxID=51031 RepID=A0ABR1CFX6_NECAM
MERELRLKAFIEEYARVVQLFDDIVSMKESMGRLETYMVIMVCQVGVAMIHKETAVSISWNIDLKEIRRCHQKRRRFLNRSQSPGIRSTFCNCREMCNLHFFLRGLHNVQ